LGKGTRRPYDEWELMALMHHSASRLTCSSLWF